MNGQGGRECRATARVDRAARLIGASAAHVYSALTNPGELVQWLPPHGSRARIDAFDPRPGGEIRITITFLDPGVEAFSFTFG